MRIFVSHRLEDEKKNEATKPPVTTIAPRGGKDFSALLSSAAHHHVLPQKKSSRRWTVVIEGGLLIKQLDHESAKEVDRRWDAGLPILGYEEEKSSDSSSTAVGRKVELRRREQWTGGVPERENEVTVEPIVFTNLFDRMEVEIKAVKRMEEAPRASKRMTAELDMGEDSGADGAKEIGTVLSSKTFVWNRINSATPDSRAFFINFDEEGVIPLSADGDDSNQKGEYASDFVASKIKLYRRQGAEGNYVPSEQMCDVFFPTFIGKKALGSQNNKERAKTRNKRKRDSLDASMHSYGGGGNEVPSTSAGAVPMVGVSASTASAAAVPPPPQQAAATATTTDNTYTRAEREVVIPQTISMDEALQAVFFYIRTRGLQDATDLSIINNDDTLASLFGCSRMLLSAVTGLMLQRGLLVKVEQGTHPIVFNYEMTVGGAEPLSKKSDADAKKDGDITLTRTRADGAKKDKESAEDEAAAPPIQTMLSCDADIEIPNLFHSRTRDILRRTKAREYDFTSCRNKAKNALVATNVNDTTAKLVVDDVIAGKGYSPHHKQALMALAKSAHDGGESQRASLIDLRTTSLMEKLEEQTMVAKGYWDVIDACKGL